MRALRQTVLIVPIRLHDEQLVDIRLTSLNFSLNYTQRHSQKFHTLKLSQSRVHYIDRVPDSISYTKFNHLDGR